MKDVKRKNKDRKTTDELRAM